MWWRRNRKKTEGARETNDNGFSRVTHAALTTAGWTSGRPTDLATFASAIADGGFVLHDAAAAFLRTFSGLEVDVPVDGAPEVRGFVHLDPRWLLRFCAREKAAAYLPNLIRGKICPVGTTSGHSIFILMDDAGATYLLDRDWSVFAALAANARDTVEVLCDGRNGRVDSMLLDEGKPTGHVLRRGDEQRFWGLEDSRT